jgi:hypothetical protein
MIVNGGSGDFFTPHLARTYGKQDGLISTPEKLPESTPRCLNHQPDPKHLKFRNFYPNRFGQF